MDTVPSYTQPRGDRGPRCLSYPALPRAAASEQPQRLAAFLREFVSVYFSRNTTKGSPRSLFILPVGGST